MFCKEISDLVEQDIAGTLNDDDRIEMERHFACCARCHVAYENRIAGQAQMISEAEFKPDEEYWRNFHTKLTCEMNQRESFHDRLHRWKLTYFPAALCQYSTFGLFKLGVLAIMILLTFLIFRTENSVAHTQAPLSIIVEKDSTGMPVYRSTE